MDDDKTEGEDLDSTETVRPDSQELPERVGPYRILERLGEGGMGAVYLAEQTEPVRRRVALKIIKHGMDTKQVVARFEAERQALAMMDHPYVAKVFDAGSTPDGRPYFAMEYVLGVSITEHCDRQRLTTRERLELFQQVCEGVQHAHQNAIIHRDLKPSNVLVSYRDGKTTPKIIDFGVAKAIRHRLTEKTLYTEMGVLIGTPEYMSPEQAEMTGQNVDTRTDVYSLGVVLYELLVGALPFDPRELRQAGYDEIRRKIREDEPSKPSARLSTLGGERSTESAKRRRTDPSTLRRQLSGDLDWITMRALEKDRARRYGSPSELAADLERHLTSQPVLAGPPSTTYRARKFVRRHRVGVAVATAGVILLAGIAVRERIQSNRIAREAATAEKVSEFLVGLFEVSDPSEARGNSITAREILDKGANEIDESLADQPEVQARLMRTMGNVYRHLGLYEQAEPLLEQALATTKRVLGNDHRETLGSMNNLANLYGDQGRYDEVEPLYLYNLVTQKRLLGDDHPDTLNSMNNVAILYKHQGRYAEAESLYVETLETRKRVLGDDHPDTMTSMNNLAALYASQGRYDEAEPLFLETLETRKRMLGDDHPDTLASTNNLANLYKEQGRYDEAEPLYLETIATRKRVLGDDHPDTLASTNNLGNLYRSQGRYDEAEPLFLETLETRKRVLGNEHPNTLGAMYSLAYLYYSQGRYAEAEPLRLEILEIRRRVLGDDHPDTLASTNNLGNLYRSQGRYDEAEPLFLETLETRKRVLGDEHPDTLASTNNLANLYRSQGRYAEAEPLYLETLETRKRVLGDEHPKTLSSMRNLAYLYYNQGRYDEAEPLYVETIATSKRVLGDNHPNTLWSMNALANLYRNQGRYAEAEPLFLETLETRRRVLGDDHPDTLNTVFNLADLYKEQGLYDQAEPLQLQELEATRRLRGDDHPSTLTSMNNLANLYHDQGRYDEAESLYLETLETRKRVLGDDHPDTLWSMNNLAWLLLTREPTGSRDPQTALRLALGVAEKNGYKDPNWLDTLSLAYHLTGDTVKAIENQKKAIALLPEGESVDRTDLEEALAKFEAALKGGKE